MARTPRTTVSNTSGQGTSRYSYQHAYAMGQRGAGASAGHGIKPLRLDKALMPKLRQGASSTKIMPQDTGTPWNISYGDTYGETWDEMSKKDGGKKGKGLKL